jgi:hypothetical protein
MTNESAESKRTIWIEDFTGNLMIGGLILVVFLGVATVLGIVLALGLRIATRSEPSFWPIVQATVSFVLGLIVFIVVMVGTADLLPRWIRIILAILGFMGLPMEVLLLSRQDVELLILGNISWVAPVSLVGGVIFIIGKINERRAEHWTNENLSTWDSKITLLLQQSGEVRAGQLEGVPPFASQLLLQQYAKKHSEETIFSMRSLKYRNPEVIQDFLEDWQRAFSTMYPDDYLHMWREERRLGAPIQSIVPDEQNNRDSSLELLRPLVDHLCNALSTTGRFLGIQHHEFYSCILNTSTLFEGTRLPEQLPVFILKDLYPSIRFDQHVNNRITRTLQVTQPKCGSDDHHASAHWLR